MVTISLSTDESKNVSSAIIALIQATTHAPNLAAYSVDIFWALELLDKIKLTENNPHHDGHDP